MEQRYLRCKKCSNIIALVRKDEKDIICCGEPMVEIIPGEVNAAKEKHVPVYSKEGSKVTVSVGDVAHPMQDDHYIQWISIQTKAGNQRKALKPGDMPKTEFLIDERDEIEAVYAYCNLHGLWKNQ